MDSELTGAAVPLAQNLDARIAAAMRGDPSLVLALEAEAEAAQLWRLARRPTTGNRIPDQVLRTLIWLYWRRFRALPPGEHAIDVRVASQLAAALTAMDRSDLPPPFQTMPQVIAGAPMGRSAELPHRLDDIRRPLGDFALIDDGPDTWRTKADLLLWQARHGEDMSGLDEAIRLYQRAIDEATPTYPQRPACHAMVCAALLARFERFGDAGDIERALGAGRAATAMLPRHHPDRLMALIHLAEALRIRYRRHGRLADLDEAIELGDEAEKAVAQTGADRRTMLAVMQNLSIALRARFRHTGNTGDINGSIHLGKKALDWTVPSDPDWPDRLTAVGLALRARFETVGDFTDINEAIRFGRQAVEAAPRHHPEWGMYRFNLSVALRRRFEGIGDQADLDEAIQRGQEAVAGTAADHPRRSAYQISLGNALLGRYQTTEDLASLDEAIVVGESALRSMPTDQVDWALLANTVARGRSLRAMHFQDPVELGQAIGKAREILRTAPPSHAVLPLVEMNLADMLRRQYRLTRDPAVLDESIAAGTRALRSIPADHPERATALSVTSAAIVERAQSRGDRAEVGSAIRMFMEAAHAMGGRVRTRITAAEMAGRISAAYQDWQAAADGYATAVSLLPLIAFRGLDRVGRERALQDSGGVAAEAVGSALEAGRARHAVELLDQGRNILWSQLLDSRTELTALEAAAPELASRLKQIRGTLDAGGSDDFTRPELARTVPPDVDEPSEAGDETLEHGIGTFIAAIARMGPSASFVMYSWPTPGQARRAAGTLIAEDPKLDSLVRSGNAILGTSGNAQEGVLFLGGHIDDTTLRRARTLLAEASGKFVAGTVK